MFHRFSRFEWFAMAFSVYMHECKLCYIQIYYFLRTNTLISICWLSHYQTCVPTTVVQCQFLVECFSHTEITSYHELKVRCHSGILRITLSPREKCFIFLSWLRNKPECIFRTIGVRLLLCQCVVFTVHNNLFMENTPNLVSYLLNLHRHRLLVSFPNKLSTNSNCYK